MTVFSAVNEFMLDRNDAHGFCQATYNESCDRIRELENIAVKTAAFCKSLGMTEDQPITIALIASETRKNDDAEQGLLLALIEEEMAK